MKLTSLTLAACLIGSAGLADDVAPGKVQFDDAGAVAISLTGTGGDAINGAMLAGTKSKGNCVACHAITALADVPFHGEVGPSLDGAGSRWNDAELRGLLEGASARLAAERGISPEKIAEMEALLRALDDCFFPDDQGVDFALYSARNAEFHAALATLSNSNLMQRELERVNNLPFASPSAFLRDNGQKRGFARALIIAHAQHCALIDAIVAREGTRAESIAREHARIVRKNLERMLREKADGQVNGINAVLTLV